MREAASFIACQTRSSSAGALPALLRNVQAAFRLWSERRKLRQLTELDDHLLSDIGLSRADVRWALNLPYTQHLGPALEQRALGNRARGWRGQPMHCEA